MTFYNTFANYVGDDSTTDFAIPFSYLSEDDVVVTRQGGAVSYIFLDPQTIRLSVPLATGDSLKIERDTSLSEKAVVFNNGSPFTAGQMNAGFNQLFNAMQESNDTTGSQLGITNDGSWDAISRRIANTADPVSAQDVATKNYVDTGVSSSVAAAAASATAALASANTATTKANAATTSATNAASSESNASSSATSASGSATTASNAATTATTKATEASASAAAALASETNAAASEAAAAASAALIGSAILDGDFSTNGLMKRTGAGAYGIATDGTDYLSPDTGTTVYSSQAAAAAAGLSIGATVKIDGDTWFLRSGNYSALVTADTVGGAYFADDAIATTAGAWARKREKKLYASWFGVSTSNTAAQNDARLQAAVALMNAGDTLCIDVVGTVPFSDTSPSFTISNDDVTLHLVAGCAMRAADLTATAIFISGDRVRVEGPGKFLNYIQTFTEAGDFSTTTGNVQTLNIIEVSGDDCVFDGIGIDNPVHCGIFLDNCNGTVIRNCYGSGNFPYSEYNSSTTLNLYFVYFDPADGGTFTVEGCTFDSYISPVAVGNLSGSGTAFRCRIVNNKFKNCWDHAVYGVSMKGTIVSGNQCVDCRKPFAIDAEGAVITGNTTIATDTTQSNHFQGWSLRNAKRVRASDNYIEGVGAAISLDATINSAAVGTSLRDVVSIVSGGSGYIVGEVITLTGGTLSGSGAQATLTVLTVNSGAVTSVSITTAGGYSVVPADEVSTTASASGTGATFQFEWFADIFDNEITDNTIIQTAASSELEACIRVYSQYAKSYRNKIDNNRIHNRSGIDLFQGAIYMQGTASHQGYGNSVTKNRIVATNINWLCYGLYQTDLRIEGNIFERANWEYASTVTLEMVYLGNSIRPQVYNNDFIIGGGCGGLTARGITVDATCTDAAIVGNKNKMRSSSLVNIATIESSFIIDGGTDTYRSRNHYNMDYPLTGTITLNAASGSAQVQNNNVLANNACRVKITPRTAGAALEALDHGVYAEHNGGTYFAAGYVTIVTGDANTATNTSSWNYEIDW